MDNIASTHIRVSGIRDDRDVKKALQALYDVFAAQGLGQATFEVGDGDVADLFVKHKESVTPDLAALDAALARAGDFHIVG